MRVTNSSESRTERSLEGVLPSCRPHPLAATGGPDPKASARESSLKVGSHGRTEGMQAIAGGGVGAGAGAATGTGGGGGTYDDVGFAATEAEGAAVVLLGCVLQPPPPGVLCLSAPTADLSDEESQLIEESTLSVAVQAKKEPAASRVGGKRIWRWF